jgi:multiple sugar transport system ATP-binding protein
MNFLEGSLQSGSFSGQGVAFPVTGYEFAQPDFEGPVSFGIRPEHVATGLAVATAPVQLEVPVSVVEPLGADTLALAEVGGSKFWIRMEGEAVLQSGDSLTVGFDPSRGSFFDAVTEKRI